MRFFRKKLDDHYYFHIQINKVHMKGLDFLPKPQEPQFWAIFGNSLTGQ